MLELRSALVVVGGIVLSTPSLAAAPAFSDLDKDHDGMLTKAEASSVKVLDFDKADTNRDGRLDRAEYVAAAG